MLSLSLGLVSWSSTAYAYTSIAACTTISQPGEYRLTADITTNNPNCINITSSGTSSSRIIIDGRDPISGAIHYVTGINLAAKQFVTVQYIKTYSIAIWDGNYNSASNIMIDHVRYQDAAGTLNYAGFDGISNSTIQYSEMAGGRMNDLDDCAHSVYRPPSHVVFTHNIVTATQTSGQTFDFRGGSCPRPVQYKGTTQSLCPATNLTISFNKFTDNNTIPDLAGNPRNVYLRCARENIVQSNRFISTAASAGFWLRDDGSDNQIIDNYIEINSGSRGALPLTSGSIQYRQDSFNIYRNNVVRARNGLALNHQSIGDGNEFYNNIFWANGSFDWNEHGGNVARVSNGSSPTIFDHNTFYNEYPTRSAALRLTAMPINSGNLRFTNNLLMRSPASSNGQADIDSVMSCDTNNAAHPNDPLHPSVLNFGFSTYIGNNNLFFISGRTPTICELSLSGWKSASTVTPDDASSAILDPQVIFTTETDALGESREIIRPASASSAACNFNGTYAGARPCSGDLTSPGAPANLNVH